MTTTTFPTRTIPAAGPNLPWWKKLLQLPLAWGELHAFRLMDEDAMRDAGLSQADLDAATLADFLNAPRR